LSGGGPAVVGRGFGQREGRGPERDQPSSGQCGNTIQLVFFFEVDWVKRLGDAEVVMTSSVLSVELVSVRTSG